jgi:hypothetical protein
MKMTLPPWLVSVGFSRIVAFNVLPLTHSIPNSLIYSVPLFLKRQCDRTLGQRHSVLGRAPDPRQCGEVAAGHDQPRVVKSLPRIVSFFFCMEIH